MPSLLRQGQAILLVAIAWVGCRAFLADAWANDGRDRYQGRTPTTFVHVAAPRGPRSGYRVLPRDMRGGADGDRMFRWARREAVDLVHVLAFRTATALGVGAHPLAIFDLSAENGDTPIQLQPGKSPRGRHPGGSHDGGLNLDLGYYLSSEKGLHYSPDYAACGDHFLTAEEARRKKRDPKQPFHDAWRCRKAADRLDVARQSYFYVQLFTLHLEQFGGDLLEEVGVDEQVARAVLAQIRRWVTEKRHGATPRIVAEMERVFNYSPYEGWAWAHHHHTHLRLRNISADGRFRPAFERLRAEARRALLRQSTTRSGRSLLALELTLSSTALSRTLAVHVLHDGERPTGCRFRLDGRGAWVVGEWRSRPCQHEWDLGHGLLPRARLRTVEVEIRFGDGRQVRLKQTLQEPRKPAFLYVGVEPQRLRGELSCTPVAGRSTTCTARLDFPRAYGVILTGVRYLVTRRDGSELVVAGESKPGVARRFDVDVARSPIWLVRAELTFSGRQRYVVPLFAGR